MSSVGKATGWQFNRSMGWANDFASLRRDVIATRDAGSAGRAGAALSSGWRCTNHANFKCGKSQRRNQRSKQQQLMNTKAFHLFNLSHHR